MATVHDVAAFILAQRGPMTAMKLQKLVYYAQAMSLVHGESPIFGERIQAWSNGPVVAELFDRHRGAMQVSGWAWGNASVLSDAERRAALAALARYGDMSAEDLSRRTHRESPWLDARKGLPTNARGDSEISVAAMKVFYRESEELLANPLIAAIENFTPKEEEFYAELRKMDEADDLSGAAFDS